MNEAFRPAEVPGELFAEKGTLWFSNTKLAHGKAMK